MEKNDYPKTCEPKQNNRFKVTFPESTGIDGMFVKSIEKPSFHQENHFPWNDMAIRFWDPIGPSISQQIHNFVRQKEKRRDDFFEDPLFQFTLETLDPTGVVIEKWEIEVAMIVSVNFGKYNCEDETSSVVTMRVRPAKCVLLY